MRDYLLILLQVYLRPLQGFSRALDQGNLVLAAVGAALVTLPLTSVFALVPVLLLFVPVCIAIIAAWDGLGGTSVVIRRDYAPLAICILMAWTAALLPVAALTWGAKPALGPEFVKAVWLWGGSVAAVYFAILSILAVRAVHGTGSAHATAAVIAAATATFAGVVAYNTFGFVLSYFASPFILYLLYASFRPDFSSFTTGLSSSQSFRRNLEACAINPRDSDAQYQLGLIYQQRRNYSEALPRFEKARDIDPSEPGPHYQLGRIAREQGRHEDALVHFQTCARLDDKHSSSEVWRDLGATNFELGNTDAALAQLEKYTERREYDPEGSYWLGQTYKRLNRPADARSAFERAVEAGQTAPRHRRQQTARWLKLARSELRR